MKHKCNTEPLQASIMGVFEGVLPSFFTLFVK
nr:MAG TPA: hypothetical protein [Caudoviricetes sp.]